MSSLSSAPSATNIDLEHNTTERTQTLEGFTARDLVEKLDDAQVRASLEALFPPSEPTAAHEETAFGTANPDPVPTHHLLKFVSTASIFAALKTPSAGWR